MSHARCSLLAVLVLCGCSRPPDQVAVIDVDAVLKGYKKSQSIYAAIDEEKRGLEAKGQGMVDEIKALAKGGGILEEEAREELEARIREKSAALDLFRRTATRTLMDRTSDEYRGLMAEIRAAADAVAKRRGVRVILDSSAVAYSGMGMDVTRELVEELNRRFAKAGGK